MEIKPGAELNKAVAEAIGKPLGTFFDADLGHFWTPSTDLNDAFAAAEAVGLFRGSNHIMAKGTAGEPDGPWWIQATNHLESRDGVWCLGEAPTLALAICAAILKVKHASGD